jgi:FkbM family methyltransferase
MKIHGILHIGAHDCEEEKFYHAKGIRNIIWIEALKEKVEKFSGERKIYNYVVSDKDDQEITFKITNNYQSSSILPLKTHLKEHPHIHVIENRVLKTKRMDTVYEKERIDVKYANFLNLDIQGAELMALKGMGTILNNFDYVYTEVNQKELYEGCCLLGELDEFLGGKGFKRVELNMTKFGWGDALYIRNK